MQGTSYGERALDRMPHLMVKHVPLRVVICGAGARGREHVELIRQAPEVELVGVADLNAEALERLHLGPAVARSVNLTTLLDATQPDLVVLATPPSQRVGIVQDAVACGSTRAIVIEKPLALTLTDADRLLALCTEQIGRAHV